ncbi:MAG: histidinol dehydrogenase [Flavisolibacter sp.]
MQIINKADRKDWTRLLERPGHENSSILRTVQDILLKVREKKDLAVRELTLRYDAIELEHFKIEIPEIQEAVRLLPQALKLAIAQAKKNIETFHKTQLVKERKVETTPGVMCWSKNIAIEKVGLYIPGGTAPLFSTVLMLGIPAIIAGCTDIILCSPCNKDGKVHPAILYTAHLIGITNIYKIGGAQAIAAMAFGTETIPKVFKIFGPGNQYVTAAKQLVQMEGTAIDMPAGPSEVCVLADETADPGFVASDLLSQAEHGPDSQVILISTSIGFIKNCIQAIEKQLNDLTRSNFARKALINSKAFVVNTMEEAIDLVNEYGAEHLIINCEEAASIADKIKNGGSVFIGPFSPESAGDYASGTNHTLPTNGFAKAYSGVSVDSYIKKVSFQQLSKIGLMNLADTVIEMASAEGLDGHARSIKIRVDYIKNDGNRTLQ